MIEGRRGKIVNVCSVSSELARQTNAAYTATKGALRNLTKAMCADWARYGIQANAPRPRIHRDRPDRAAAGGPRVRRVAEGARAGGPLGRSRRPRGSGGVPGRARVGLRQRPGALRRRWPDGRRLTRRGRGRARTVSRGSARRGSRCGTVAGTDRCGSSRRSARRSGSRSHRSRRAGLARLLPGRPRGRRPRHRGTARTRSRPIPRRSRRARARRTGSRRPGSGRRGASLPRFRPSPTAALVASSSEPQG